ncbi:unnamed protein product [Acidithrix sp. C25]|nr:unnamed protein product [Acidithrix sp. C25]
MTLRRPCSYPLNGPIIDEPQTKVTTAATKAFQTSRDLSKSWSLFGGDF